MIEHPRSDPNVHGFHRLDPIRAGSCELTTTISQLLVPDCRGQSRTTRQLLGLDPVKRAGTLYP
jgi:hypothetical protein